MTLEHSVTEPDAKPVTVIVELPAVDNPVAVNDPVPATVTVIDAVKSVAAGKLLEYVTVYVPIGNAEAELVSVISDVAILAQIGEVPTVVVNAYDGHVHVIVT